MYLLSSLVLKMKLKSLKYSGTKITQIQYNSLKQKLDFPTTDDPSKPIQPPTENTHDKHTHSCNHDSNSVD